MLAYKDGMVGKKDTAQIMQHTSNAIHYFSKALALESEYVDAHFFKAKALLNLKKDKDAQQLLKRVIALP
jgi:tetratricopeptide (TPR) repeat protein